MYATCTFCHGALGANDAIEQFPVGRRLAFDGERGRLWAVCPRCARWNLAPMEERWEAIEACERAYRGAMQRVSTDNIALARVKEGTDLVRIGRPLLPEYSLWRYGRILADRARRAARFEFAATTTMLAGMGVQMWNLYSRYSLQRELGLTTVAFVLASAYGPRLIKRAQHRPLVRALRHRRGLAQRMIDDPYALRLRRAEDGWALEEQQAAWRLAWPKRLQRAPIRLTGAEVTSLMPSLLVLASPHAPADSDVQAAVQRVEQGESADALMDKIATSRWLGSSSDEGKLTLAPVDVRLALEMTLQQDDERRALTGELGALYARWEAAERIARIADGELTRRLAAE